MHNSMNITSTTGIHQCVEPLYTKSVHVHWNHGETLRVKIKLKTTLWLSVELEATTGSNISNIKIVMIK